MNKEALEEFYAKSIRTIRSRVGDYMKANPREEAQKLIALWREHFPDAANESSDVFHPLVLVQKRKDSDKFIRGNALDNPTEPQETWTNNKYLVTIRRFEDDNIFKTIGPVIMLGIASHDNTARHDWRDMQAIKNQLAGSETEAFELFPAQSRVNDPSNYFIIWCFPKLKMIKLGSSSKNTYILDSNESLAPQRALAQAELNPSDNGSGDPIVEYISISNSSNDPAPLISSQDNSAELKALQNKVEELESLLSALKNDSKPGMKTSFEYFAARQRLENQFRAEIPAAELAKKTLPDLVAMYITKTKEQSK